MGYGPGQAAASRVKPSHQSQAYDLPSEDAGFAGDAINDNYSNHHNMLSDRQSAGSYANKFKDNVKGAGSKFNKQADADQLSAPYLGAEHNNIEILDFDRRSADRESEHIEPELLYAQDSFNYVYMSLRLAMGFTDVQIQGFLKNQYAFFR